MDLRAVAMKVIFLDIDGVLVKNRLNGEPILTNPDSDHNNGMFDKKAVDNFNRLLSETGASIVVSSSWRLGRSKSELSFILKLAGVHNPPVIGATPFIWDHQIGRSNRGKEILEWLAKNPYVEDFIVIDDCDFQELEGIPLNRYIKTTMDEGFGPDHTFRRAIQLLASG
jgi:hypothetical protein